VKVKLNTPPPATETIRYPEGSLFTVDGEPSLLVQTDVRTFSFIHLSTGNRWGPAIPNLVGEPRGVTLRQLSNMLRERTVEPIPTGSTITIEV
jgi:hypothetical protein